MRFAPPYTPEAVTLRADADKFRAKPLVPQEGLEPPHPCEYQILSLARLPVPPLGQRRSLAPREPATCPRRLERSGKHHRRVTSRPARHVARPAKGMQELVRPKV